MLSALAWLLLWAALMAGIDIALDWAANNALKGWSFGDER